MQTIRAYSAQYPCRPGQANQSTARPSSNYLIKYGFWYGGAAGVADNKGRRLPGGLASISGEPAYRPRRRARIVAEAKPSGTNPIDAW